MRFEALKGLGVKGLKGSGLGVCGLGLGLSNFRAYELSGAAPHRCSSGSSSSLLASGTCCLRPGP